jgi:ppGpp synthetase/RelA/SpoT-type nucleotidyltranferase
MIQTRTVKDRLRDEYFALLPDMQRTLVALEANVRHLLLPVMIGIDRYEQVRIVSRLKECESAIDALRRRQEARGFDEEKPEAYTLSSLRDLVGLRILVFPSQRIEQARSLLQPLLREWSADPVPGVESADPPIALKYFGRCASASTSITAELQIVSSLTGSFWDVEHAAVYKTSPDLQGVMASPSIRERYSAVLSALREFETEFERLIREARELESQPNPPE